ncbi:hypothetical protein [Reichenbachiella ulvae]|uniref:DoxX-like family protein n=1 Tax=Reichenbachiella ulvae TaxID=2980104 RepID=A0ABT3CUA5_9BACT|nr:hypothetical protein [Reichenbachiella ulvae]MCV9387143.1 hypothetical protein [Reichenbachiella ulvae]
MKIKSSRSITVFLAVSMFMVGFLKFFDPFKGWYAEQISSSGFGELEYAMGIAGELAVGLALLAVLFIQRGFSPMAIYWTKMAASALVVIMMAVGIFVHLHPDVPAAVLPLKIKPPYIPGFFLLLAVIHARLITKELSSTQGLATADHD